jgi:hypothetical protein
MHRFYILIDDLEDMNLNTPKRDIYLIFKGKRTLWLNWRDIKNPAAGGAEVLTHEIGKRLVTDYRYIKSLCYHHLSTVRLIQKVWMGFK